jgi:hypothetical protein
MKALLLYTHLFVLGLLLLAAGEVKAQIKRETLDKYDSLDRMLRRPLVNQIITDDAYEAMLYKKQVALTGLAVPTGKTLGVNLTTDDKSVAANAGIMDIRPLGFLRADNSKSSYKNLNVTPIISFRSTSEKGFVAVFSNNRLQTINSFGGSLLFFGSGYSSFNERTKKDLHWRLNKLRAEDREKWSDNKTPYNQDKWQKEKYRQLADTVARFVLHWRNFQRWLGPAYGSTSRANRYYEQNGDLTSEELNGSEGESLASLYLMAEHDALPLLGDDWDELNRPQEGQIIHEFAPSRPKPATTTTDSIPFKQQVKQLADSLRQNPYFIQKVGELRLATNEAMLEKRLKLYDSLQQNVSWARKIRFWATTAASYNSVKQPLFEAGAKAKTYATEYIDRYWQMQAAGNFLVEGERLNLFLSGGGGLNNALVFKSANLVTYQTSAQQVLGLDTITTVSQKQLYPTRPESRRLWQAQAQLTLTYRKNVGVTASYEGQFNANIHGLHTLTMGVFVPVKVGSTTLLVLPLARARTLDLPYRWSYGVSVTASIPGFSNDK